MVVQPLRSRRAHRRPGGDYVFSTDIKQYDPRCAICHLVFDGRNLLPLHEIVEVRQQWESGEWTLNGLAAEFGVARNCVLRIVNGESWATLTMRSAPVAPGRQRGRPSSNGGRLRRTVPFVPQRTAAASRQTVRVRQLVPASR